MKLDSRMSHFGERNEGIHTKTTIIRWEKILELPNKPKVFCFDGVGGLDHSITVMINLISLEINDG